MMEFEWPSVPEERGLPARVRDRVLADIAESWNTPDPSANGHGPVRAWEAEVLRRPAAERRRWVAAIAAVIAVAVVVFASVIVPAILPSGAPFGPAAAGARSALRAAADSTESAGSPVLEPGQYRYLEYEDNVDYTEMVDGTSVFSMTLPHSVRIWVAPDRPGLEVSVTGEPEFLSPHDRAVYIEAGRPPLAQAGRHERELQPGEVPDDSLEDLAEDPEEALAQFRRGEFGGGDAPDDAAVMQLIGDRLVTSFTDPANQATLYRAAALIPGIRLVDGVTDRAGRQGTAVALAGERVIRVLVFDPQTGGFLENATYERGADLTRDEPITWTTVFADGVADASGGDCVSGC